MNTYTYEVFGIILNSEFELPELLPSSKKNVEVKIRIGKVPSHLPVVKSKGILFEAARNDFLFKIDGIGSYRVQNGNKITIQPASNVEYKDLRVFLFGSSIGALLHQRGKISIHGSAVAKDGISLVITGFSTAGKSSLAAGLHELGYEILTDDIAVVDKLDSDKFSIHPGIPLLKLWKDVVDHLDYQFELELVRPSLKKYYKPFIQSNNLSSNELKKIVVLSPKNSDGFSVRTIVGAEKFNILKNNTFRLQYLLGLEQTANHFQNISELANSISLYKIERPDSPLMIHELANFVEKEIMLTS